MQKARKIVYVDMDDVLCDYRGARDRALAETPSQAYPQAQFDFYRRLSPLPGAIEGVRQLAERHDVWILTRPSYKNPMSYTEKRLWVEDRLGLDWCERLILCPDKTLLRGDYLIDDVPWEGFIGTQLLFGRSPFTRWSDILKYFAMELPIQKIY